MEQQTASTICENACDTYIRGYSDKYMQACTDYMIPPPTEDVVQLLRNEKYLKNKISELEDLEIEPCQCDVRQAADSYIEATRVRLEEQRQEAEREHESALECLKRKHAVLEDTARSEASAEVSKVLAKRDELLKYKDNLTDVFEKYSITPNNVEIASDTTIPELIALYDEAIKTCDSYFKMTSNTFLNKLQVPVSELTESEGWMMLFVVFIAITIASPVLLVWYTVRAIRSTSRIYTKLEDLKVASALMYEGDFDRFLDKEKYEVAEEDTSDIDSKLQEDLQAIDSIDDIQSMFDEYINTHLTEMQNKFNNAYESAINMKKSGLIALREAYTGVTKAVQVLKDSYKPFGSTISEHTYMGHSFQVGSVDNVLPVNMEFPMKNIVFQKQDNSDYSMLSFIKILMLNALLSVKEKHMYITIVDSTDLGTHFAEFFDNRFPDIITLDTSETSKVIATIKKEEESRIKTIKDSDIDTLNKENEEVGKIPLDYKLYIFTGDTAKIAEDINFKALMKYSAKYGIWLWYYGTDIAVDDCIVYNSLPSMKGDPLIYEQETCTRILDSYADWYEKSKDKGIEYLTAFGDRYVPRDKWWTFSTKKGIELNFGLINGDPDKGDSIVLGDAPVHGNMVGTTGAGKSVCINQLLASLITKYSPNELQLVMIDFKNVEFSFYADPETHSFSRLPHSLVLAGTKDGEYAVSIFKYLCAEMERRSAIFAEAGVKKLEEYRDKYPDKVMPRILLLIDEYQVMFTELPKKIVEQIQGHIRSLAKLARFCGCHMLFTSQSMKGTMDKDVQDQFALRVALRCSSDTATAVLGDDAPSKIKTQFGYLYTNEDGGSTKDRNKLWRTPFISNDTLNGIIAEINKMWGKPNLVEFYDESRTYTDETLQEWYDKYPDVWSDSHLMILGEKTAFSTNKAPVNMKFLRDDGENLLIYGNNTSDTLNMVLTMLDNIKHHEDAQILIHSADRDSIETIDMPSYVDPKFVPLIDPSYSLSDFIGLLEKVIEGRQQKDPSTYKPLYVFCLYFEKQTGYGRNNNSRLQDRFDQVIRDGCSVDIHTIVVLKNRGELSTAIFKQYNHKIVLRCDGSSAYQIAEDNRPEQFPTNPKEGVFALYAQLGSVVKFKVYQHTFAKPIVSNEVFIG